MTEAVTRTPGRPRSPLADEAIIDATIALLTEGGFDALTMDAVAARAGVGKATIYRRWSSKEELVVDAIVRRTDPVPLDTAGSVREDLVAWLEVLRDKARSGMGRLLPCMIGAGVSNPTLVRHYRDQIITPRRAAIGAVIQRGIASGELRPDLDVELALDQLAGPLVYRILLASPDEVVPDDQPARIVDAVLRGLAPDPS